jgi:hypothetical protein
MVRVKLTARKHVHAAPRRNVVPTDSHSDGQNAGYFLRTLRTMLLALGYSELPLFIGVPRLLRGNSYLWCVRVIIYERPTTDHPEVGVGHASRSSGLLGVEANLVWVSQSGLKTGRGTTTGHACGTIVEVAS